MENEIFMRLIVFFDLPTKTKKDRRIYIVFRKKLLENGFFMLQYSVYCRICKGMQLSRKYIEYIKKVAPPNGNIRILQTTDKQFGDMEIIIGKKTNEEKSVSHQMIIEF
jgi:CRISPR-associated protein Cas2